MPTWATAIIAAAAVLGAAGVIWRKVVSPAANLIATAEKGAPVFREMVEQFADMPEALRVLRNIAAQFHTDSGTTLRDVINRLEVAAEANRVAIEALVTQEKIAAEQQELTTQHLTTGQEASRLLAQEDRVQIASLLAELRGVRVKVDNAAAGAVLVADDLEAAHRRAEEQDASAAPGEASDAAARRPDAAES